MLEQAIVDAEALKEAAVKNAETLVLEKYSNQIKDAVETLLEQEEGMDPMAELGDELGGLEDTPADPVENTQPSTVIEDIPLAVTSENNDQVEIPLDALYEEITKMNETMRMRGDFIGDSDLYEHDMQEAAFIDDEALEEMLYGEEADAEGDIFDEGYGVYDEDEDYSEGLDLNELDEDLLETIAEKLTVDLPEANKSGWLKTPMAEIELAEEEVLAAEQDSERREKMAAMKKALEEIESVNESITNENNNLQESLDKAKEHMIKLRDTVLVLDKKLQESNLSNAKLLYQNKALNSDSMNERQKHKLVESISNAESIEEAKVIFETLNNTVGSTSRKSQPNSLSEAVQKTSSMVLSSRKKDSAGHKSNPAYNRWKFLAGIDKN
tara:strand:+ start:684 stop:1832 length:1149 start_codon:yes stop_codon:yes gene_type:complete